MSKIIIHSPFAKQSSQGNSITATRIEEVFRGSGYGVSHSREDYTGEQADVMVALNARKSATAVARFRYLHPGSKLVIILTGTDINHPDVLDEKSETWISMKLADRLVVLHDMSMKLVPEVFRDKTEVIYPSVRLPEEISHVPVGDFSVIMAGNMRREKNPALARSVAEKLSSEVRIHHYGEAEGFAGEGITCHGTVPHCEVLGAMARSHILLNTSLQEGGANAICEAICLGLPVVASAIPGNVGMFGEGYAGLFANNDLGAAVGILQRAASDGEFYGLLKRQVTERAALFAYKREAEAWVKLLNDLSN